MTVGLLGRMLAFELSLAGGLWLIGKVAPELKRQAGDAVQAKARDLNPELAEQLEQLQNGAL